MTHGVETGRGSGSEANVSPSDITVALSAVDAQMRAAVASPGPLADGLYRWLQYHMGWADGNGQPAEERRAKGVRPRLCVTVCAALGGALETAVPAAAAVELTHEFSLVHDDIQDGDELRRGRPAVWTRIGAAQGINLGDALFCLARAELDRVPADADTRYQMHVRYNRACLALAEGQYLDLDFESRHEVTPADYLGMVRRKTGALLGLAAELGALAAGADAGVADALGRYGTEVGVAFQIADDGLGLWGDPEVTGKPAGADLSRGKKSFPVLLALEEGDLGALVRGAMGTTGVDVAVAVEQMAAAGFAERTRAEAETHGAEALAAVADVTMTPQGREALERLAQRAIHRVR